MRFHALVLLSAAVVYAIVAAAQTHDGKDSHAGDQSSASAPSAPSPSYRVQAGDQIEISFAMSPDFNQTVYVLPDGFISLREAGSVQARGLTLSELCERIDQAYSTVLHKPTVSVAVKDYEKPYFIVTGEVGKPGKYDLRTSLTVSEGVAIAGGFTSSSKHSQVVLFRPTSAGLTETHVVDLKRLLAHRSLGEDLKIKAGDMIYVPQNRISKFSRYIPTSSLGFYANPYLY